MIILRVALPVPLYQAFDYRCDTNLSPAVGMRVRVPFGSKKRVGIVIDIPSVADIAESKLKPIIEVIDDAPIVDTALLSLARFLASYYHHPFGDVLHSMLPALLRQGKPFKPTKTYWQKTSAQPSFSKQAHKQLEAYELIANADGGMTQEKTSALGIKKSTLKALADKNYIKSIKHTPIRKPHGLKQKPLILNAEQQQAFAAVYASLDCYAAFLLAGVTGSGKTEVYLQLIDAVLAQKKQVLVLVPEIGLTPQTLSRFENRFDAHIVTLHSHVSETERLAGWTAAKVGEAHIIIGTRLSVLAPFANLGLIIVDEEHDSSYKQKDGLRYHARDVAMVRAQRQGCPVLLGSATPSFESLHRAQYNKLTQLNLNLRAGSAKKPAFKIVDMRGQFSRSGLAQKTLEAIAHTLDKQEQVLVFLNRRGYAPVLVCSACGWQADCPKCDAHLTLHRTPYVRLMCHHCGWQERMPNTCNHCGSENISPLGVGTARLEEVLQSRFPNTKLIRIDTDTMRKKQAWQGVYDDIEAHKSCILLGTQMLAKGHHFENVTLVVLVNVDQGLLSSDFRAPERIAQLSTQVAGRAGRGKKRGMVLVQSLKPDGELLSTLVTKGYLSFASQGLAERKLMGLPPFSHAVLIRAQSKTSEKTSQALKDIKAILLSAHGTQADAKDTASQDKASKHALNAWGPLAAPMEKKNGWYHGHLLLMSSNRKQLHNLLSNYWQQALKLDALKSVRLSLDVDPMAW